MIERRTNTLSFIKFRIRDGDDIKGNENCIW